MDGEWALIEFRPGRYVKVSPDGTVLGRATEAEVRTWFAALGWDLEAGPGEPPDASRGEADEQPETREPEDAPPPPPEEPPAPEASVSPTGPDGPEEPPIVLETTPDLPPAPEAAEAAPEPVAVRPAEVSVPEPEEVPATQLTYDLAPAPPAAEPEAPLPEEPAPALPEPTDEDVQELLETDIPDGMDEPVDVDPLEPADLQEDVETDAEAAPGRAAGAPDRAVWTVKPRASRAGPHVRRPSTAPVQEAAERDLDVEERYGAPTADAKDWWLWVDPRQEHDYASSTFDLRAFLLRAMDRYQEKPWSGGLRPVRLAFDPGSAPEGIDAMAEELGLEPVADPKVAPSTYMLGALDSK